MNNIFSHLKKNKPQLLIVADDKEANEAASLASYLNYEPFVLTDFRANFDDDLLSLTTKVKFLCLLLLLFIVRHLFII